MQFICGSRILAQLQTKHEITKNLSQLLNAPEQDLPSAASRLIENGKDLEKQLEAAKEALLAYEAKEMFTAGNGEWISKVFEGRSIQEMQKLARLIASQSENAVVILINETTDKLQFVCARGSDSESDMKGLAAELLQKINGKGGGTLNLHRVGETSS